jgi:hypothetical protein
MLHRRKRIRKSPLRRGRKRYIQYKEVARALVHAKLAYYNQFYNFKLNKVFIKNHRSRWGSCSSKGNLNFNYNIVFLPPETADYLVVHELCHLSAFNHSPKFWALIEHTVPNYKVLRKELRRVH